MSIEVYIEAAGCRMDLIVCALENPNIVQHLRYFEHCRITHKTISWAIWRQKPRQIVMKGQTFRPYNVSMENLKLHFFKCFYRSFCLKVVQPWFHLPCKVLITGKVLDTLNINTAVIENLLEPSDDKKITKNFYCKKSENSSIRSEFPTFISF